jgi:hypothetical protein
MPRTWGMVLAAVEDICSIRTDLEGERVSEKNYRSHFTQ